MTIWQAVAYGTADGDVVEAWGCAPLPGFPYRLDAELDGVYEEAVEATAACGAKLLGFDRAVVAGWPALRRIEQLPATPLVGARYAASLVVMREADLGVEITVTRGGMSGASIGEAAGDSELELLERDLDDLIPRVSLHWDTSYVRTGIGRRHVGGKTGPRPLPELAAARRAKGLNQAEFAARVGVSHAAVTQWERGRYGVAVKFFRAIADVLDLSVAEVARIVDGEPVESGGPGAGVWEVVVQDLPRRPCTALTGPAGLYMPLC